jgi:hypothetical protein
MGITRFRITAANLLPRIHEAAKSSSNVEFIPPPNKRSMAGMMQFKQALRCLQEGSIVGRPKVNDHGDWEFQMERFAANQWTVIDVAASVSGARVTRLYVLMEK